MSDGVSKINGLKAIQDMSMDEIDTELESNAKALGYQDVSVFDSNKRMTVFGATFIF